jgi:hypothetical protein
VTVTRMLFVNKIEFGTNTRVPSSAARIVYRMLIPSTRPAVPATSMRSSLRKGL